MYMYQAPKEASTPKGIRWCLMAFVIYIALLILQAIMGTWLASALAGISSMTELSQILTILLIVGVVAVTVFIMSIVVLVFYFIGFGYLYDGRKEFTPEHARYVGIALWSMVGAIIATLVGFAASSMLSFSAFDLTGMTPHYDIDIYYAMVACSAVTGVITAALVAVTLVLSIRFLALPQHKMPLYVAAGIGTATPAVVSVATYLQLPKILDVISDTSGLSQPGIAAGIPTLLGGILGLVTFIIFFIVYLRVLKRLNAGELRPVVPQPTPRLIPVQVVPIIPAYPPYYPTVPAQPVTPPPQEPKKESPPGQST